MTYQILLVTMPYTINALYEPCSLTQTDRLIESHKQLCRKLEIVKELSTKLVLRTINVKFRLDRLVENCEEDATTIQYGAEPLKSRICYAACCKLKFVVVR